MHRTAEEVSFEWLQHRISSTDSKIRSTLNVSIIDSGSETFDLYQSTVQISALLDSPSNSSPG